jgi:hypothetical protein
MAPAVATWTELLYLWQEVQTPLTMSPELVRLSAAMTCGGIRKESRWSRPDGGEVWRMGITGKGWAEWCLGHQLAGRERTWEDKKGIRGGKFSLDFDPR